MSQGKPKGEQQATSSHPSQPVAVNEIGEVALSSQKPAEILIKEMESEPDSAVHTLTKEEAASGSLGDDGEFQFIIQGIQSVIT